MVSKLNNLRKLILGTDLFKQCQDEYVHKDIIKKTISDRLRNGLEMRLNELKDKELCLEKCDINMLLNACKLNERPHKKDYLCISDECKNKIYYDEYRQTHYYEIIKLDCMNEKDKEEILKYAKIEKEQKDKFRGLLSLYNSGCKEYYTNRRNRDISDNIINRTGYIYYIAYNKKDNILGGVCQVDLLYRQNTVHINLLTSRSKLDRSSINKGIGTSLLNKIKEDYQNNKYFYSMTLWGVGDAVPFYLNWGFKMDRVDEYSKKDFDYLVKNNDDDNNDYEPYGADFIYIFKKLYNTKSYNIKKYIQYAYKNNISELIEYYYDNNLYLNLTDISDNKIKINLIDYYKLLPIYIKDGFKINSNDLNKTISKFFHNFYNEDLISFKRAYLNKKNKVIDEFILKIIILLDKYNFEFDSSNLDLLHEYFLINSYNWITKNKKLKVSDTYQQKINNWLNSINDLKKYYNKL